MRRQSDDRTVASPQPRRNLTPGLGYSIRRSMVDDFFSTRTALIEKGALILDVGGHKTIKRGQFDIRAFDLNVLVVNIVENNGTDIVADACRLPVATGAVDAVICAEVLEHIAELDKVVREIARVLRPGGLLLATVPFLFPVHADPHDYGRYTAEFWRWKLADCGMEESEIVQQGGYYATMGAFFAAWFAHRARRYDNASRLVRAITFRILNPLASGVCGFFLWLDRRTGTGPFHRAFATGYGIVARKKDGTQAGGVAG
jgi:SAM-dependent methyltransferase